MNSNDLQKRVAIYKYDRSINAAGTPIEQWLFYKWTYCGIRTLSGSGNHEDLSAGLIPTTYVEIILRQDPLIDYNCEIRYNNNTYKISYIEEITKDGFLKLRCVAFNENQADSGNNNL
jgi:hypothetical protein